MRAGDDGDWLACTHLDVDQRIAYRGNAVREVCAWHHPKTVIAVFGPHAMEPDFGAKGRPDRGLTEDLAKADGVRRSRDRRKGAKQQ